MRADETGGASQAGAATSAWPRPKSLTDVAGNLGGAGLSTIETTKDG